MREAGAATNTELVQIAAELDHMAVASGLIAALGF